ncbi:hypothetical protein WA026_023821 [Henosepilachna vigintioctopunctata]|uniref:Retropepsins domain-containing protein n=1 Tax=Henosepilachna vigintioctopunctata TaxID=420089 RepID=A0AAW1UIS2_9CUCU
MFSSSKTPPSIVKVTRIFENKKIITEKKSKLKGLPTYITSKLDRQEVTDPILLFSALRMYENHNKNVHKHFAGKKSSSKSEVEFKKKTPCQICYKMGKKNRFHSEDLCWFRQDENRYKKLDIPPLIEVEVILNDKLKCTGIYDPGSNITLINSKLIKVTNSKENYFENKFNTIGGGGKTTGLIRLNGKILTIEKEINAFICNDKNFTHDLILGLDTIKRFGLTHDGNLNIQLQENANPGENKYISPNEKKNLIIKK